MKIAVLLHGKFANFKSDFKSLLRAIGPKHEVDVFYAKNKEEGSDITEYLNLVKPVAHIHEEAEWDHDFENYPKHSTAKYKNTSCMFKTRLSLWEMFEKQKTKNYDLCISSRADIHFESDLNINYFIENKNKLFIPFAESHGGYNDHVAIGSCKNMKVYLTLYNQIKKLLEGGTLFHPETLLLHHLHYAGTSVERFGLCWSLARPTSGGYTYFVEGRPPDPSIQKQNK